MEQQVIVATPSTLLTILRSVAYAWQQEALADNARVVFDLGRELYDRLGTLGAHVDKLGRSISGVVQDYNTAVGSLESPGAEQRPQAQGPEVRRRDPRRAAGPRQRWSDRSPAPSSSCPASPSARARCRPRSRAQHRRPLRRRRRRVELDPRGRASPAQVTSARDRAPSRAVAATGRPSATTRRASRAAAAAPGCPVVYPPGRRRGGTRPARRVGLTAPGVAVVIAWPAAWSACCSTPFTLDAGTDLRASPSSPRAPYAAVQVRRRDLLAAVIGPAAGVPGRGARRRAIIDPSSTRSRPPGCSTSRSELAGAAPGSCWAGTAAAAVHRARPLATRRRGRRRRCLAPRRRP